MKTINLTSNLNLQKPASDEKYNIQTQNTNMDILDTSIKALQDKDATLARQTDFISHTGNRNNPHNVTKEQLGLSNVTNQRQIPAIQTTVTDSGIPIFDGNGYTLRDSGFTIKKSVPEDAKFTDTIYVHPESFVSEGTYKNVYIDKQGHVIGGSNPTTLEGYGITNAAPIDHSHTAEEIGADIAGSADNALNQAKEYTDLKVAGQYGENILKKQIVESLPVEDINVNTIYLVLKPDTNGNDNYNEYINLDGTANGYEWIGNTNINLTDYYNKAESNNLFLSKSNIANNLTTTDDSKVLGAKQGKTLDTKVITNTNAINSLNNKLLITASISIDNDYLPFFLRKSGHNAQIYFGRNKSSLSANTTYTMGTIPEEYFPTDPVTVMIPIGRDGKVAYFSVTSNGTVAIRPYANINENEYVYNRIPYFCK